MNDVSRTLIQTGLIFVGIGLFLLFLAKGPGVGRLPGDFVIKKGNFTLYLPITTCLIISAIITVLFIVFGRK